MTTEERARVVPRGMASTMPGIAVSAHGSTLVDAEGREYVDFASGISVVNTGHGHPRVVAAIHEQADRLIHSGAPVMMPDVYVRLCARLVEVSPVPAPAKALLINTGAEAVENAVKIVRQATRRSAIVSFHNAFHGRTLMALSLTGKVHPYKQAFGPYAAEVHQVPYPYPYRDVSGDDSLQALQQLFDAEVPAEQVAGVIVEPVQGEGGFIVPPDDFLRRLHALLRERGIPLIVDEIQTGLARTGTLFACERAGVAPDLLLIAKSLAGGLPLAAVVGRADLMDAAEPGGLGGTFGGNPVACAAALAVLDVIRDEQLCERAVAVGQRCLDVMRTMQRRLTCIGDVRGVGAMVAMELVRDGAGIEPAPELARAVLREAHARGLALLRAGLHDNVVRLLMPLTIPDDQLQRGLQLLEQSVEAACADGSAAAAAQ